MVKEVLMKRGLITVITGNGKGKTTSAIGRAIDAVEDYFSDNCFFCPICYISINNLYFLRFYKISFQ